MMNGYNERCSWAADSGTSTKDIFASLNERLSHAEAMGLIDGVLMRDKDIVKGFAKNLDMRFPLTSEDVVLTMEHATLLGYPSRASALSKLFKCRINHADLSESLAYCEEHNTRR